MFGSEKRGSVDIQADADHDFLVRQIRQLVNAIANLVAGRPAVAELDEAEEALRAAAHDVLHVDTHLLDRLTPASALQLLVTPHRVASYIEVVGAQVMLARAVGDTGRADALARRAEELRSRQPV